MVKIKKNEQDLYNKDMLVLARESRNLSTQELAEKIGVSRVALWKAETGEVGLTKEMVQKASRELDYPVDFFAQQDPVLNLDTYYYRKKLDISKKELKKSEAEINISKISIERLLKLVEPPEPNYPKIELLGETSPKEAAQYVRQFWKIEGKIDNLSRLLEDNGIFVVPVDFGELSIDGLSILTEKDTPIIFVNKNIPADRTRLTIAHEFGHLVMHIGRTISEDRDVEKEAFLFGAELLVPESEIKGSLGDLSIEKLKTLKQEWKVSMGALIVRAKTIGIISDADYQALWKEMSKLGYKRREPEEFEKEEPTLLKEIIQAHIEELMYSEKELAAFLCLKHEEFARKYLHKTTRFKIMRGGSAEKSQL